MGQVLGNMFSGVSFHVIWCLILVCQVLGALFSLAPNNVFGCLVTCFRAEWSIRLAGKSGRYRVSRRCQAYYCIAVNLRQARWMSRTLFPIAAHSFDVLTLNMRKCVSRSNVKCCASAEAAVLQDSNSYSSKFLLACPVWACDRATAASN